MAYYKKFANGDLRARQPLSLGHESSGVVVGIGPQVSGFGLGDRVALEVGVPCDTCSICRKGRYNLCKKLRFRSSAKSFPHYQGTLQERINHPAQWCHKLVSLDWVNRESTHLEGSRLTLYNIDSQTMSLSTPLRYWSRFQSPSML